MGISQFPAASTAAGPTAFAATIPLDLTTYEHIQSFDVGVYTISCNPTTTNAVVTFATATSVIATVTTVSGTKSYNLTTAATRVYISLLSGGTANTVVTIDKTAGALTPDDIGNGTVDTITSTSTYNTTGLLYVLAYGGGQGGGMGGTGNGGGGTSGSSGKVYADFVYSSSAQTVTIGTGGAGQTTAVAQGAGNNSTFGNLLSSGSGSYSSAGAQAANGNASTKYLSVTGNNTTGSGGGGANRYGNGGFVGGGSGIGTGGTSSSGSNNNTYNNRSYNVMATAGTGYAAGGGAGGTVGNNHAASNTGGRFGAAGTNGVVYVLRGW